MKKPGSKRDIYLVRKQIRSRKRDLRIANSIRHYCRQVDIEFRTSKGFEKHEDIRKHFVKRFYKKRPFNEERRTIEISGAFGLEEESGVDYFLEKSKELLESKSSLLTIDFAKATRIWPSAVTLLCAMSNWVVMVARKDTFHSKIQSNPSYSDNVNSYLAQSGLYDYVGIREWESACCAQEEVVKIRKEKKKSNVEEREDEIVRLLEKHTNYSQEDIVRFNSIILTEVFINVTEHGVPVNVDNAGWWILAQYHPTHKFISLCVCDNGIGVKNSLLTGPQKKVVKQQMYSRDNDGEFIKKSCESNVSGAYSAPIKTRQGIFHRKRYLPGSRRGHGLASITALCKKLGIRFSLVSGNGCYMIGPDGQEQRCEGTDGRYFAGTLYHLLIPAGGRNEDN